MNIIFDLGGVVFNWNPQKLINSHFNNPEDRESIKKNFFDHNDWIELDRGTLNRDIAVERASIRSGLDRCKIAQILENVPRSLTPIDDTINLFDTIKQKDHKLYVLSNMHSDSVSHLLKTHRFWDLFNGIVFSSDIKMVKPEMTIYNYILEKYNLDPEESIFIDDTLDNLNVAKEFKIDTILFKSPKQCKEALIKKGVI